MILFVNRFKKYFIYGIFSLLALPIFLGWYPQVQAQDLLQQMTQPSRDAQQMIIGEVSSVSKRVWDKTIMGNKSIIARVTRLLLVLTIALSVTMILYNGMVYIIETWQGKEWKSLAKNVILIVVWILIALFSSVIITLIQSIPNGTIKDNKVTGGGYTEDQGLIE